MRKPFSELIGFSFVFFRNLAPIVSHMAPKEFHGRLTRFFKSSQPEYIMNVCSKEKMSVKRSICRTNLPQKSPKASEFARPFPKSSKRILFVLFLITVGGGRRGLSTLAHRRNTVDCQVVAVPTFPITAFERSRWRDGRFACYAPHVMPQGRAFNCDFRFSLIFLSQAKSTGCKRKKIQFP
jgi:hypothetical protein